MAAAVYGARLRKEALAFVAKRLSMREPVSEYEVQQRLMHNMTVRGLTGPPPVVAAGGPAGFDP